MANHVGTGTDERTNAVAGAGRIRDGAPPKPGHTVLASGTDRLHMPAPVRASGSRPVCPAAGLIRRDWKVAKRAILHEQNAPGLLSTPRDSYALETELAKSEPVTCSMSMPQTRL